MRRTEHGFTLLELVIALAIVGALLAVAFGGMRVALAAWRQGEDRAEVHQQARGVTLAVARAVGGAYPYAGARGDTPDVELLFTGEEHRLELVTQSPPVSFALPIAFTAMVLEVAQGEQPGLVIRERALPNKNPFTDAEVMLRDPSVKSLTLGYLDETGSWHDRWSIEEERGLPRAIRISFDINVGSRTEPVPPITISLRVTGLQ